VYRIDYIPAVAQFWDLVIDSCSFSHNLTFG
jgi:hypothetical protein